MGYRHSREDLLDAAVEVVLDVGLAGLTFASVSRRLGIADRTVVYYFPTKDELVSAVLSRTTSQLQELLGTALGAAASESVLLQRCWTALSGAAGEAGEAALRVYFESVGLAVRGREPYRSLAESLVSDWTSWIAGRLTGDAATRLDRAGALVATLDGLLLVRAVAGHGPADAAARGLGLRTGAADQPRTRRSAAGTVHSVAVPTPNTPATPRA
jgi:AcrR family transcriptional regulator